MSTFIEVLILVVAIAWDFISLYLNVRRAIMGSGPSGIPLVSWLVYVAVVEWRNRTFIFASVSQAGLILTGFHLLCHFVAPWLVKLFVPKKEK